MYVKFYNIVASGDVTHMKKLVWEKTKLHGGDQVQHYGCIDIDAVKRLVHIVPSIQDGKFYYNHFVRR